MKRQIRYGVFETNSSSTHSITMMMKDDYDKWENEGLYLKVGPKPKLYTKEEVIKKLHEYDSRYGSPYCDYSDDEDLFEDSRMDYEFKLYNEKCEDLEEYYEEFTTPNGETVVAFGQYGYC